MSHGMEEVVDMENELSDKLEDFAQRLEDADKGSRVDQGNHSKK